MGTENMEILKVVIADDEVRICQLIQALIDWDSMGMKVVGIAHNGEEAFRALPLRILSFSGIKEVEVCNDISM